LNEPIFPALASQRRQFLGKPSLHYQPLPLRTIQSPNSQSLKKCSPTCPLSTFTATIDDTPISCEICFRLIPADEYKDHQQCHEFAKEDLMIDFSDDERSPFTSSDVSRSLRKEEDKENASKNAMNSTIRTPAKTSLRPETPPKDWLTALGERRSLSTTSTPEPRQRQLQRQQFHAKQAPVNVPKPALTSPPFKLRHQTEYVSALSYWIHKRYSSPPLSEEFTVWLCDDFDFYSASVKDKGWGCGVKNLQTLSSALIRRPAFAKLFGDDNNVPTFEKMRELIDDARLCGFEKQSLDDIGLVAGTRKWVGSPEVYAVLSSRRVRCVVKGFQALNGEKHTELLTFVHAYFNARTLPVNQYRTEERYRRPIDVRHDGTLSSFLVHDGAKSNNAANSYITMLNANGQTNNSNSSSKQSNETIIKFKFCPPIFFQHAGHSCTIIGCAIHNRTCRVYLLVVDPDLSGGGMKLQTEFEIGNAPKQILRSIEYFSRKEYELLFIGNEIPLNDEEFEAAKVINGHLYLQKQSES